MPTAPARLCGHVGCAAVVLAGTRCAAHIVAGREAARAYDQRRAADPFRKLYQTRRWRNRVQPAVLRRDPLCYDPFGVGCVNLSALADHVVPARIYAAEDANRFFDVSNLRGCCESCHARKTRAER